MALTQVKDIEIVSLHKSGNGVRGLEWIPGRDGEKKKRYWTLWFQNPSGLTVGEVLTISGFLDATVSDPFTGDDGVERRAVNFSLQNPRVDGKGSAPATQAVQETPATSDGWGSPAVASTNQGDEQPF